MVAWLEAVSLSHSRRFCLQVFVAYGITPFQGFTPRDPNSTCCFHKRHNAWTALCSIERDIERAKKGHCPSPGGKTSTDNALPSSFMLGSFAKMVRTCCTQSIQTSCHLVPRQLAAMWQSQDNTVFLRKHSAIGRHSSLTPKLEVCPMPSLLPATPVLLVLDSLPFPFNPPPGRIVAEICRGRRARGECK